jgi:hypothetical protein
MAEPRDSFESIINAYGQGTLDSDVGTLAPMEAYRHYSALKTILQLSLEVTFREQGVHPDARRAITELVDTGCSRLGDLTLYASGGINLDDEDAMRALNEGSAIGTAFFEARRGQPES